MYKQFALKESFVQFCLIFYIYSIIDFPMTHYLRHDMNTLFAKSRVVDIFDRNTCKNVCNKNGFSYIDE